MSSLSTGQSRKRLDRAAADVKDFEEPVTRDRGTKVGSPRCCGTRTALRWPCSSTRAGRLDGAPFDGWLGLRPAERLTATPLSRLHLSAGRSRELSAEACSVFT